MARIAEIKIFGMKAMMNTLFALEHKAVRQGIRNAFRESAKILVDESQAQLDAVVDTKPHPQTAHPRRRRTYDVRIIGGVRSMPSIIDSSQLYWWHGTGINPAAKGGRIVITADAGFIKVHVFPDFRAKWFATGTKERHTKGRITSLTTKISGRDAIKREKRRIRRGGHVKFYRNGHTGNGHRTGKITATHFFTKAQAMSREKIFTEMDKRLYEEVKKVCDKYGVVIVSRTHL